MFKSKQESNSEWVVSADILTSRRYLGILSLCSYWSVWFLTNWNIVVFSVSGLRGNEMGEAGCSKLGSGGGGEAWVVDSVLASILILTLP